jgi:hypothetical protein
MSWVPALAGIAHLAIAALAQSPWLLWLHIQTSGVAHKVCGEQARDYQSTYDD